MGTIRPYEFVTTSANSKTQLDSNVIIKPRRVHIEPKHLPLLYQTIKNTRDNDHPTYHQTRKIIYFSTHFKHKVGDRRPTFEPSLHHCPPHRDRPAGPDHRTKAGQRALARASHNQSISQYHLWECAGRLRADRLARSRAGSGRGGRGRREEERVGRRGAYPTIYTELYCAVCAFLEAKIN